MFDVRAKLANMAESRQENTLNSRFQNAFRDILCQLSNGDLDEDGLDSIVFRLEQLLVHLVRLCIVNLINDKIEQLKGDTIVLLRSYSDIDNRHLFNQKQAQMVEEVDQVSV